MIFETQNLLVKKLRIDDLDGFHELESNPKVLLYADGEVKKIEENRKELQELIAKYSKVENDFWIYAVVRKYDLEFVGTVALVKDNEDDEIGYRFLEKHWHKGYATELCGGLISYCKAIGIPKIVGYVVDKNIASSKVLNRYHFKKVTQKGANTNGLPTTKYELIL